MIRHIIVEQLTDKLLDDFILNEIANLIPDNDSDPFRKTVIDDLIELNPQRIAGLGITKKQLEEYLNKK